MVSNVKITQIGLRLRLMLQLDLHINLYNTL